MTKNMHLRLREFCPSVLLPLVDESGPDVSDHPEDVSSNKV